MQVFIAHIAFHVTGLHFRPAVLCLLDDHAAVTLKHPANGLGIRIWLLTDCHIILYIGENLFSPLILYLQCFKIFACQIRHNGLDTC